MKETEITVEIFNKKEEAERILQNAGFKITEQYVLYDEYYSTLDMVDLKKCSYEKMISSSVVVRKVIKSAGVKQTLVYKEKTVDKNGFVIAEEKTSVDVSDFEKTCTVLKKAGLTNWCNCLNKSTVFEKEFSFALQEIDGLGLFLEIEEDESLSALTAEQKTEKLIKRAKSLGLKTGDDYSVKKNYLLFKNKTDI